MPFMGVRISWLILDRKEDFSRSFSSAFSLALISSNSACLCSFISYTIPEIITGSFCLLNIGLPLTLIQLIIPSFLRIRHSKVKSFPVAIDLETFSFTNALSSGITCSINNSNVHVEGTFSYPKIWACFKDCHAEPSCKLNSHAPIFLLIIFSIFLFLLISTTFMRHCFRFPSAIPRRWTSIGRDLSIIKVTSHDSFVWLWNICSKKRLKIVLVSSETNE